MGRYLGVYRGCAYRNGWDSVLGRFKTSKSQNKLRIMGKNYTNLVLNRLIGTIWLRMIISAEV
jgi:hypothetical protein